MRMTADFVNGLSWPRQGNRVKPVYSCRLAPRRCSLPKPGRPFHNRRGQNGNKAILFEIRLGAASFTRLPWHRGLAVAPSALMGSSGVVVGDPAVEIGL